MQEDKDGNLNFGLDDWAAPDNDDKVDSVFINALLKIKFIRILLLAQELDGMNTDEIKLKEQYAVRRVKEKYSVCPGPMSSCSFPQSPLRTVCGGIRYFFRFSS